MTPGSRAIARRLALVLGIVVLFPRLTWPHAELLRSQPTAGSVIESEPREIHIWFSEPVEAPSANAIRVTDPDGRTVATAATVEHDDPTEMSTPIAALTVGTYLVRWRAISADGHPIDGMFTFSVGRATATPVAADAAPPNSHVGLQAAGRWLHLLALSLVIGPLGLIVLGIPREVHHRLWTLSTAGAIILIPAALVMLVAQSAAVAGTLGEGLRYTSIEHLLLARWGLLWTARTLTAVVLAVVLIRRSLLSTRWALATAGVLATALILTTSMNGHPGATPPIWLSVAVDWAHTAASAMWIGGLFALVAAVLPWVMSLPAPLRKVKLAVIVPQFSTMALLCVQLLFLTGMYHVWAHVSSPGMLTTTDYGRALLVKLGLVALTLLGGAVNLMIIRPRLASPTAGGVLAARVFRQVVSAEAVLVVAILGSVAVLTSLPPASAAVPATTAVSNGAAQVSAAPPALALVGRAGTSIVTLSLASAEPGSNRATVALQGVTDAPPSQVRLRIQPPEASGISTSTVTPERAGSLFRATLPLAPAGTWGINVVVTSSTGTEDVATFHVTLPLRGAGELLALADERMNALRSVTEDVDTFAEGERLQRRYIYQAPDRRLHEGDILEITAGDQHYMRHGSAWHVQTVDRFTWPSFRFFDNARDVAVAGHETIDGHDCVIVSFLDGPDKVRTNLWIASDSFRVIQQAAATPEGFVVRKYSHFDGPTRIRPPDVQVTRNTNP